MIPPAIPVCRDYQAPILWVRTPRGKWLPLDREAVVSPDPTTRLISAAGTWTTGEGYDELALGVTHRFLLPLTCALSASSIDRGARFPWTWRSRGEPVSADDGGGLAELRVDPAAATRSEPQEMGRGEKPALTPLSLNLGTSQNNGSTIRPRFPGRGALTSIGTS